MKLNLLFLFTLLFSLNAISQSIQHYFSGTNVYDVDVLDSLVVFGTDFQIGVYNSNTDETTYFMPSTSPNGSSHPIESVGIDDSNSLWAAIPNYQNGLFEYNGVWTNYLSNNSSLPNNYPHNIYINHDNNKMWLDMSNNNKGFFDGTTYTSIGPYAGDCEEHNDTLWVAYGQNGLVRYANGAATILDTSITQLSSNRIDYVTVDSSSKVWFTLRHEDTIPWGNTWYTIGSYDGTTWNEYDTTNSALPYSWTPQKLQIDTNNNLVIATRYGLIEFDGSNATEYNYYSNGNFPEVTVNTIKATEEGVIWIATQNAGLLRYSGGVVDTIETSKNILPSNRSTSVYVASDGKVWIAMDGQLREGLFMIDTNDVWTSYENIIGETMGGPCAIEEDALGNIYVVGDLKTMKFNGSVWTQTACGGGDEMNTDIAFDSFGNYWKGKNNYNIIKCDDNFEETVGFGSYLHRSVEVDFADNIWIGTQNTIVKMDQNHNTETYGHNDLGAGSFRDIEFDSNQHLWAAGDNLLHFDGTSWTSFTYPFSGYVSDLEIDENDNVWFGFLGGIGRFDGDNWIVFNTSNTFFIDDYVVEISLDLQNHTLWGSTYSGGVFSFTDSTLIAGLKENNFELRSSVYPNPATETIKIDIDAQYSKGAEMILLDMNGNIIKKQFCYGPSNTMDLVGVSSGFYILNVVTHDGFISSNKLVITK